MRANIRRRVGLNAGGLARRRIGGNLDACTDPTEG